MARENFYLLLELAVNPPEKDPKKIEEAIKKKQTDWSRLRNHPTKAIQAQKNIDLIPEIRRVMSDPHLLEKEAKEIVDLLGKKDSEKYSDLDRHIRIYLSKGALDEAEISKLATLHNLNTDEILERIKKKEKDCIQGPPSGASAQTSPPPASKIEKLLKVDGYLWSRLARGYLLEKEIKDLSNRYAINEDEIRQRAKCPIIKSADEKPGKLNILDKSIENAINDNLKILSKSSLYEFLSLPESANIEVLQEKSKEKRAEVFKVSKKDAVVTASSALAGHCIAIFKAEDSRNAYDTNRAVSHFAGFNSDIDVTEIKGKIRAEYFEALIQIGSSYGLDTWEATTYVKDYCHDRNWVIQSKGKTKRLLTWLVSLIVAFCVVSAGIAAVLHMVESHRVRQQYHRVLSIVEKNQKLEEREKILITFLNSLEKKSDLYQSIENKIKEVKDEIKKRDTGDREDFDSLMKKSDAFVNTLDFSSAISTYEQYLALHPEGLYLETVQEKINQARNRIEDHEFEALKSMTENDYDARIKAYQHYLSAYPQGRYREATEKMLLEMGDEYYRFIKDNLEACENTTAWGACFKLCERFLGIYPNHEKASEIKGVQYYFLKKMKKK